MLPRPEPIPEQVRRRVFEPADLTQYTARQRASIRAADRAFYSLIATVGPTLDWRFEGREHLETIYARGKRAIIAFWHNRVFGGTFFWRGRGIVVMTSKSFDGEYIARFIQRFGYGASRGSSSRGGGRALVEMDQCLQAGLDVAFTVDGPRGPVYEAKPGPVLLARRSGHLVLPMHVAVSRYWEVSSWDRFQIPKPFAKAVAALGEPIEVAPDADDDAVAAANARLQATLDTLRARYDV